MVDRRTEAVVAYDVTVSLFVTWDRDRTFRVYDAEQGLGGDARSAVMLFDSVEYSDAVTTAKGIIRGEIERGC